MIKQQVILNNKLGLHARPASVLVKTAEKFSSEIKLIKGNKEANLKSILGVLWLKIKDQEEIILQVNGPDERIALEKIVDLIENKLRIISYDKTTSNDSSNNYTNPDELVTMLGQGVRKNLKGI
ncbi:MAG: HPr family phosphocarrier protein [Bacillota bacterium]